MHSSAVLRGFAVLSGVLCLQSLRWLGTGLSTTPRAESESCAAWTEKWTNDTNHVCVLVRTWHPQFPFLPAFLAAFTGPVPARVMFLSTDQRSDVHQLEAIVEKASEELFGCPSAAQVLPVGARDVQKVRRRHGIPDSEADYAYGYTDAALGYLFGEDNSKNSEGCGWLLVTNGDNLYATGFLEQVVPLLAENELIAWDFVSHYYDPDKLVDGNPQIKGSGKYFVRQSVFRRTEIDLGAMLVNVHFFRRQKRNGKPLRFLSNTIARAPALDANGTLTKFHLSDGLMAEELANRTEKWSLFRRVLLIHQ